MTRSDRVAAAIVELPPLPLVIVAEAAWISVIAGLLQEFALHQPEIGIPVVALFVALGTLAARLLGRRLGDRWPAAALGLIVVAAVVGVLASPAARAALAGGIGPAVAAHPGGLLAGLAVLRGFAHASLPLAESTVARLLALGTPGLALASLLGGVIAEPFRTRFLGDALGAAIVFVGTAVLALAFTRLAAMATDEGLDWRRNPAWLALTLVLLATAIIAAVPLAAVAGTALSILVGVALGPLLILGLVTGFDRTARWMIVIFATIAVVTRILAAVFGGRPTTPGPVTTPPSGPVQPSQAEQLATMSLGGLLLLAATVAVLILIAAWMRRTRAPHDDLVDEIRTIDRGDAPGAPRRWPPRARRAEPADAVQAYVALLADLARHPAAGRRPGETPAEHAARLRSAGAPSLALDLLAADYALARDAGLTLSAAEDRRGIERWRILRRRLADWARTQALLAGETAADGAVPEAAADAEGGRR